MSEHSTPISAYPNEEWAIAIRYAEEHAGELAVHEETVLPTVAPGKSDLARSIFDMCNAMNRAYAEELRKGAR